MDQNQIAPDACIIEMDPEIYIHNIKELRISTGDKVKICAVMKADAYGHGIEVMMDSIVKSGVEYISAIDNCEFRIMQKWFKEHNVNHLRLLRIAPATKEELIESIINNWDVEEVVGSLEQGQYFSKIITEISQKLGRDIVVKIHINVETAMGRMGFRKVSDVKLTQQITNLKVVGIMTHLAREYEAPPNDEIATRAQVDLFQNFVSQLTLESTVIKHVANSAALVKKKYTQFDMVRAGSIAYGEDKDQYQDPRGVIKPIFHKWRTSVVIILRDVPPNSPIGYNGIQRTRSDRDSTTATIRVGYDYGFPQYGCLNNHFVLIRGKRFPIIGKTSMNMLVVDITEQDQENQVQLGDEVVIVGKQGKEFISWEEFSEKQKKGITEQYLEIANQCPKIIVKSE
ncbi:unnamed protein product [Paramecium octaurelia]|uniref:Alanine racemase C-terminal domain-containing protein n=1 Tax=Paramecium octaurelia TaxID=43137 RepID=A0A8S1Y269_PAROT|nr:unnamed protein product [Paramecium octaurelia]